MPSKDEILAAIRACGGELGRCPTVAELKRNRNIGLRQVRRYFSSYARALREAGFDPHGPGYRVGLDELFADWARVARHAGKIPTLAEYEEHSRYSVGPLLARFGGWTEVPRGLLQFATANLLEKDWGDVLELIKSHEDRHQGRLVSTRPPRSHDKAGPADASPLFGTPLSAIALAHAPTNELGVVYLFGILAARLGLVVTRLQPGFPDGEVLRRVGENQWQRLRLEFEFESRNFLAHQHDPELCDLIVCWLHNWPECPSNLEVLELSAVLRQDQKSGVFQFPLSS